jgi:hypothetical protein
MLISLDGYAEQAEMVDGVKDMFASATTLQEPCGGEPWEVQMLL